MAQPKLDFNDGWNRFNKFVDHVRLGAKQRQEAEKRPNGLTLPTGTVTTEEPHGRSAAPSNHGPVSALAATTTTSNSVPNVPPRQPSAIGPRKRPRAEADPSDITSPDHKRANVSVRVADPYAVGTKAFTNRRDSHTSSENVTSSNGTASVPLAPRTQQDYNGTSRPESSVSTAVVRAVMPDWYRQLRKSQRRNNADSSMNAKLGALRQCTNNAMRPTSSDADKKKLLDMIHEAMFWEVKGQLLRDNFLLHDDGLARIFTNPLTSPPQFDFHTKLDAEELWFKWAGRSFSNNLMHGIKFIKDAAPSIDPNYPLRRDGAVYGNNDLVNGQWWPAQLCLVRDGAHKSSQGGIAGRTGEGAWSVLLGAGKTETGEQYPDHDEGDVVQYCGTDGKFGTVSEYTQRMLETSANGQPLRLIRSSKCAHSRFAPAQGYRYDGLYKIQSYEILDAAKQRHRFTLARQPGQDPIRFEGPGQRPTKEELAAWKKLHAEKKFIVNEL